MGTYKKDKLKQEIKIYIDDVLNQAAADNNLDYFNIEISNHHGHLQLEFISRNRKKVY